MNYLQQLSVMGKLGSKGTEFLIPFDKIIAIDSENIREDYGDLEGDDLSTIKDGIKLPLVGFIGDDGLFHVCDGFRRFKKYRLLVESGEIEPGKIPCKLDPDCATLEGRTLLALSTASGKQLSVMEQGKGYIKLRNIGKSLDDIAKAVGKTEQHIKNCISLIERVDEEVQELVEDGKISATTVIEAYQSLEPETAKETIQTAVEIATSQGKKRATAKHLSQAKPKTEPKTVIEVKEEDTVKQVNGGWREEEDKEDLANFLTTASKEDWLKLSKTDLDRISKLLLA